MSAAYQLIREQPGADSQRADCSVVAVAALADVPYLTALEALRAAGRRDHCGCFTVQIERALLYFDCVLFRVQEKFPTLRSLHGNARRDRRYLAVTSNHFAAVVRGELVDARVRSAHVKSLYMVVAR